MKKISVEDEKRILELEQKLNDAKLAVAVEMENLTPHMAKVNDAIDAYNEILSEAKGFAEDISRQQEEYYDERSDAWQDGDKGQEYQSWQEEWANWQPDDVPHIALEADPDIEEHGEELTQLPKMPG